MGNLDFNTKIRIIGVIYGVILILSLLLFSYKHKIKLIIKERKVAVKFVSRFLIFIFLSGLVAIGICVYIYSKTTPSILASTPLSETTWDDYSKPLEIKFNVPVLTQKIKPNIVPDVPGRWVWDKYLGISTLTRSGRFYPDQTFVSNGRIVFYLTGVSRYGENGQNELGINLFPASLPKVINSNPSNNGISVKRDSNITINLDKEDNHLAEWSFKIDPVIDFDVSPVTRNIVLTPKTLLQQSTKYTLTVIRKGIVYSFTDKKILSYTEDAHVSKEISFVTAQEPLINNFAPQGGNTPPNSLIKVQFSLAMNRNSVQKNMITTPTLTGSFSWSDDMNMVFTPASSLQKGTSYNIQFSAGTLSQTEGVFSKDVVFQFQTIGVVNITNVSPGGNSSMVPTNASVNITFDQAVDHNSAQSNFSLSPSIGGNFSWNGNTMSFKPNGSYLGGTRYTMTEASGVKSIDGLDSNKTVVTYFTVIPTQIILSGIPEYYQPQPSDSCNVFAARMVLAYKGIDLSASSIISQLGYDSSGGFSGGQWSGGGDPYTQYVGNSDGNYGYGVYWGPISSLFTNRGIHTEIHTGWNISGIASSIANGHPVIIWRYNGTSEQGSYSWTASDGRTVNAIKGQHGGVVIGYKGTIDNPTSFYINDPWFGQIWMSASTFDSYWSALNRSAVVVL